MGDLVDMPSFRAFLQGLRTSCVVGSLAVLLSSAGVLLPHAAGQDAPSLQDGPLGPSAPVERQTPETQAPKDAPPQAAQGPQIPVPPYDPKLFQKRTVPAQLEFLKQYDGAVSNEVVRDKRFHKVLHDAVPGVMFHYGRDMSLPDALEAVMEGAAIPVVVRDGRYVTVAGQMGKYLAGRGFVWVDMQEGIVLGGFFFHPTNGEPTPSVTVFSKQVKEDSIEMSQLPPAFADDLARWQMGAGVPTVTTRYFIGDANEKILLEHDEDYCSSAIGRPGDDCLQMTADAADADMVAASYLDQVHYATNATAWMINSPEQVAWVQGRDRTCGGVADPLGCRIRMTHERIHVIERRGGRR
jgi:hypothetical protein